MTHPTKTGTVRTIDVNTGEVLSEKQNAMTLLPPSPDVCQECAVVHDHDHPHNQQSLFYQYHFQARHGRWPTWSDALAHCPEEVKKLWRAELVKMMCEKGVEIPADLLDHAPPVGR